MSDVRLSVISILLGVVTIVRAVDYPQWRNDGSGSAPDSGVNLVEDFTQAKVLWRSEEVFPDTYNYGGPNFRKYAVGGFGTPTVGGGRVFLHYYRPAGDFVDRAACARFPEWPEEVFKPHADDVVVCLDAETGKTLWKQVFAMKGCYLTGCGGMMHNQPMWADGLPSSPPGTTSRQARVYVVGSLGMVYCLSAEDGAVIWESHTGAAHEWAVARIEEWKTKEYTFDSAKPPPKGGGAPLQKMAIFTEPRWGKGKEFSVAMPQLGGSTLVCNDGRKGLVGLDRATGERRWYLQDTIEQEQSPTLARLADGKDYVFCSNREKGMICIDADTGEVLWSSKEISAGKHHGPVIANGMLVGTTRAGKAEVLSAGKVTREGFTLRWTMDPEQLQLGGSIASWSAPVIHRGYLYVATPSSTKRGAPNCIACVELATGRLCGSVIPSGGDECVSLVAADGYIHWRWNIVKADPDDFRALLQEGGRDKGVEGVYTLSNGVVVRPDGSKSATALPVARSYVTCPVLDGRYYYRDNTHLYCIDMRKTTGSQSTKGK